MSETHFEFIKNPFLPEGSTGQDWCYIDGHGNPQYLDDDIHLTTFATHGEQFEFVKRIGDAEKGTHEDFCRRYDSDEPDPRMGTVWTVFDDDGEIHWVAGFHANAQRKIGYAISTTPYAFADDNPYTIHQRNDNYDRDDDFPLEVYRPRPEPKPADPIDVILAEPIPLTDSDDDLLEALKGMK